MAYVFGDTMICDDADSAKIVTFNKSIGVKSVTLDGDIYDPSGTLSGGSAPSGSGILVRVQELLDAEEKLAEAQETLTTLEREYERNRDGRERWKKLSKELDIKEHEMRLLEEQVGGSNAARVRVVPFRANTSRTLTSTLSRLAQRSRLPRRTLLT